MTEQDAGSGIPVTPANFGARGNGGDDSRAWDAFVAFVHRKGVQGHVDRDYHIPTATCLIVTGTVDLRGPEDGAENLPRPKLTGLRDVGTRLFDLRAGSFSFCGIDTQNIVLIDSDYRTELAPGVGKLRLLCLKRWASDNRSHFTVRIGRADRLAIGAVVIDGVDVHGGLSGISIEAPIRQLTVGSYSAGGIEVPSGFMQRNSDGKLRSLGYGDGLLLGKDSAAAQAQCGAAAIGNVAINGLRDCRKTCNEKEAAQIAGVRLFLQNVSADEIAVSDVDARDYHDCAGVYLKCLDSTFGRIELTDAGRLDGMLVLKGKTPGDTDKPSARGGNISIDSVVLGTNATGGRSAEHRAPVYLGVPDVRIGSLSINGIGGEVVDPHTRRHRVDGQGALVYSSKRTTAGKLRLGAVAIRDCDIWTSINSLTLLGLGSYSDVRIDQVAIERISARLENLPGRPFVTVRVIDVAPDGATGTQDIAAIRIADIDGGGADVLLCTISGTRKPPPGLLIGQLANDGTVVDNRPPPQSGPLV